MTPRVKFTVIVPTRERCDTLEATLRTCTAQDYEQLEILVSDNFSQDGTRDVVASFHDPRIRYINTGRRVSMSANWEFALSYTAEGYVTYIGDDDGLLPGALSELSLLIEELKTDAVVWRKAEYLWPDFIYPTFRNILQIPLGHSLTRMKTRSQLAKVIAFRGSYQTLPCLYNALVSHTSIQRARSQSGRFFNSMIPDVYSSIVLGLCIDTHYYSARPYSISGASRHSGGTAFFNPQKNAQASTMFLSEDNISFHPRLVIAPSTPIMVAESVFQAQDHLSAASNLCLDMKDVINRAALEAMSRPEIHSAMVEVIRQIGTINHMEDYAEQTIRATIGGTTAHTTQPILQREEKPIAGYDIIANQLTILGDDFALRNIYDAAVLCKYILVLNERAYLHPSRISRSSVMSSAKAVRRRIARMLKRVLRS